MCVGIYMHACSKEKNTKTKTFKAKYIIQKNTVNWKPLSLDPAFHDDKEYIYPFKDHF